MSGYVKKQYAAYVVMHIEVFTNIRNIDFNRFIQQLL